MFVIYILFIILEKYSWILNFYHVIKFAIVYSDIVTQPDLTNHNLVYHTTMFTT